jgi:hypothetical protein
MSSSRDPWFDRPLDTRAIHNDEIGVDGKEYRKGEFMPFYIPRPEMPQVDETDIPGLLDFLVGQGIGILKKTILPGEISPHQRVEISRAINMPLEELAKPILGSMEPFILDGHHRWYEHRLQGTKISLIQIELEFEQAIRALFQFPKTYSYGDGKKHAVTF